MTTFDARKDPDATLDYIWDWTAWLAENETISSVTWIVPDGITEDTTTNDDTTATIWLSGGTAQTTYPVTCRITTNQGRTDDRTKAIRVKER